MLLNLREPLSEETIQFRGAQIMDRTMPCLYVNIRLWIGQRTYG